MVDEMLENIVEDKIEVAAEFTSFSDDVSELRLINARVVVRLSPEEVVESMGVIIGPYS